MEAKTKNRHDTNYRMYKHGNAMFEIIRLFGIMFISKYLPKFSSIIISVSVLNYCFLHWYFDRDITFLHAKP